MSEFKNYDNWISHNPLDHQEEVDEEDEDEEDDELDLADYLYDQWVDSQYDQD
jgi:hypothetical protein